MFNTTIESIREDSVTVVSEDNKEIVSPVDQVVVAAGMKPQDDLKAILEEKNMRHFVIGDAVEVRRIIEAIGEGARAAWEI